MGCFSFITNDTEERYVTESDVKILETALAQIAVC